MRENLYSVFAKNKSTDQTVHLRSLISACVSHLLESIISKLVKSKFSILSVAVETGLNLALSETPKTRVFFYPEYGWAMKMGQWPNFSLHAKIKILMGHLEKKGPKKP